MIFKAKNRKKGLYKKILASRKNIAGRMKVLRLKKKKWGAFIFFARKKFKFFQRYRFHDQSRLCVNRFGSRGNSLKRRFKHYIGKTKGLQVRYGGFKKKPFKSLFLKSSKYSNNLKRFKIKNQRLDDITRTLFQLELRLDSILRNVKFCSTVLQARQMISHGHVLINNRVVRSHRAIIKHGDIVSVSSNPNIRDVVKSNIMESNFWPIPPEFLQVNYRTLNVINTANGYEMKKIFIPYHLSLDTVINDIKFR